MKNLAYLLAMTSLAACAAQDGGSVEDPQDDTFTTDGKADAFGVEDWSPDGAAVLRFTSTATQAKLVSAGLTAKVAKSIVAQRAGLTASTYHDLAELDAAPYVGKTVFTKLLQYVAEKQLFKAAIRIPLLVDNGTEYVSITSYNDEARANGVTGFAAYTFVDVDTKYGDKMDAYNTRLATLAEKAHIEIGEMKMYAGSLSEFEEAGQKPCFIGLGGLALDVPSSHTDEMMSDMYIEWGSRYKEDKWVDESIDESEVLFGDDWDNWDESGDEALIISSSNDGGDNETHSVFGPCRI